MILIGFVGPCRKAFGNAPEPEIFQAVNKPENPLSRLSSYQRDQEWDRLAGHTSGERHDDGEPMSCWRCW